MLVGVKTAFVFDLPSSSPAAHFLLARGVSGWRLLKGQWRRQRGSCLQEHYDACDVKQLARVVAGTRVLRRLSVGARVGRMRSIREDARMAGRGEDGTSQVGEQFARWAVALWARWGHGSRCWRFPTERWLQKHCSVGVASEHLVGPFLVHESKNEKKGMKKTTTRFRPSKREGCGGVDSLTASASRRRQRDAVDRTILESTQSGKLSGDNERFGEPIVGICFPR